MTDLQVNNSIQIPGLKTSSPGSPSSRENSIPGLNFLTPEMMALLQEKLSNGLDFSLRNDITNYNEMDDWYYTSIEKYKDNPELYQLLLNNPHLVGNSGLFSPSVGDNAAVFFGSTAAEDRYYAQLRSDAVEYMNQLIAKYNDRKYTSESEQVGRMSQAGVNVDLSGGQGISPGDAGGNPFSQKDSQLPFSVSDAASKDSIHFLSMATQGVMSVVTSTFDFIGRVNQFQLQNTELASSELSGLTSADSWLTQMLSRYLRYDYSKGYDSSSWAQSMSDALSNITGSLEFNNLSKRTRKWVKTVSDNYQLDNVSSLALYEKLQNEYLTNREKNARIRSNPNFSEDFAKWMDNLSPIMQKFNDAEIADYESRIMNPKLMDSQIFHNNKSGEYLKSQSDLLAYRKSKIDALGSLFDDIKRSIPSDAWWSGLATWFTEMSRIMTIQALIKE